MKIGQRLQPGDAREAMTGLAALLRVAEVIRQGAHVAPSEKPSAASLPSTSTPAHPDRASGRSRKEAVIPTSATPGRPGSPAGWMGPQLIAGLVPAKHEDPRSIGQPGSMRGPGASRLIHPA